MLAPQAISHLRAQAGGALERSMSADIREEREDLREAAEQTLNVIMDLGLDGSIRWVSPSWEDVIGTPSETVTGVHISELLLSDDKNVFSDIVELMKKDDSHSQIIRFSMQLGPSSKLAPSLLHSDNDIGDDLQDGSNKAATTIDLEAQGIMVYDRSSGGHV